jgi:hypothetical protein
LIYKSFPLLIKRLLTPKAEQMYHHLQFD